MAGLTVARSLEKLIIALRGYTTTSTDNIDYVTGQNLNGKKRGLDTLQYGAYSLSTGNLVESGSTTRVIKKTTHGAKANDLLFFTSGACAGIAIQILSCPDADNMILAVTPEQDIAVGDLFSLKRPMMTELSSTGATLATVSAAAQTGSFDEDLTATTAVETFVAPAGAFGCFIETDDTNTTNARIKMGGVASTSSGIQFQPGRSEMYEGGSNISYCMESGTGKISVQWFVRT